MLLNKVRRLIALLVIAVFATVLIPATAARAAAADSGRLPVVIIPGIGGTELFNRNQLVWIDTWKLIGSQLPVFSLWNMNWLMPLRLASDGRAPYLPSYQVKVGDLMRFGLTDGYSGLVHSLKRQGYVEGRDLRLFPYDWRKDPSEAAAQLGGLVDRTLRETGASKVILIGHSQGGLIARDYVVRGGAGKVKATISLGTPWLGTPVAYKALAYGWDLGVKVPGTGWSVMAPRDVKLLVQNYPSVYALTPGKAYFDWYQGGYLNRGGRNLNYAESLNRGVAAHNRSLALRAPGFQSRLLDGNSHGVMQFLAVGTGRQTLAGLTEWQDWFGFPQKAERFTDGDEVVPLHSADLGFSVDEQKAERYIGKVVSLAYINTPHTLFAQSGATHDAVALWLDVIHGRRPPGP